MTYRSESQQRVLKTLDTLFGHEINGLAPGQVAKLVGTSPSNSTRDLANLAEAGMAEEIPGTGLWRVTPRLGQRALAILHNIDAAATRVADTKNRYTRT